MDTQTMHTSVAVDATKNNIHKMTKEEAQQKSDAELLQMIKDAKGHTGNDFSDYMKVSSKDLATLDEIKTLVGKDNEPNEVLSIFNQYKTKVAINNSLVKHFKDTKKAGELYKTLKPLLIEKNKS